MGALLGVVACTASDGDDNDSAAGSSDSAPSESSSGGDEGTSSGGSLSADASAEAPEAGDDDEDEGDESGAPSGPCSADEVELTNVVLEVNVNRILGEDIAAVFDEASWACAYAGDDVGTLMVHFGPHEFGEPQNGLHIVLRDGVRAYDLVADSPPPGSGEDGALDFTYVYQYESASSYQFSNYNQAASGTVDVIAHPLAGDTTVELTAVGSMSASDGWEFDLHFTGDVVQ